MVCGLWSAISMLACAAASINSAWIKRKECSFAQYEHAHRLRLISEFFRLQDRHRGTACVFDTVGVEEGEIIDAFRAKFTFWGRSPLCAICNLAVTIPTRLPF